MSADHFPNWWVSQRDRSGQPTSTITIVDGIRLQVYRHIARPEVWTAYAQYFLHDTVLLSEDLEAAQREALELLQKASAPPGDHT